MTMLYQPMIPDDGSCRTSVLRPSSRSMKGAREEALSWILHRRLRTEEELEELVLDKH